MGSIVPQAASPGTARRRFVARHRVREGLQWMILSGQRPPGSKLVQQQLAKQFSVGQAMVREALLELQACGLVETIDNRGVFVSRLNRERLLESFDVRQMHEALAVRQCCGRLTAGQSDELRSMIDQIERDGVHGRLDEMASGDRLLHHRFVEISGNFMLLRLADNYRVLGKVVRANRDPLEVAREHRAIVDAIGRNQPDAAEHLIRAHIQAAKSMVEKQIEDGVFVPQWVM